MIGEGSLKKRTSFSTIGLCSFGVCIILVALGIGALVVIAPKAPFLVISEFGVNQFNLPAYCPSLTDEACCTQGNCELTLRDPSKFNITFNVKTDYFTNSKAGLYVQNTNIAGPLYFDSLTMTLKYKDLTVGVSTFTSQFQEPLSTKVWKKELNWDITLAGIPLLRTFVCDVDTTFTSSGDREGFFTLVASIKGLKYYINPYVLGDIESQKVLNFTDGCLGSTDKCRLSTLWKQGLCSQ